MKEEICNVVNDYLEIFSNERKRLSLLLDFLNKSSEKSITDWNNVDGHVTVGAFIYCAREDKFLVLYHKDLEMFLYPGGHIDSDDDTLFDTLNREVYEECGLKDLKLIDLCSNGMPLDIDIHLIPDNLRVGMMEHYHFDFRYLFYVDSTSSIVFDSEEISKYKWVSSKDLVEDKNFGTTIQKVLNILNKKVF